MLGSLVRLLGDELGGLARVHLGALRGLVIGLGDVVRDGAGDDVGRELGLLVLGDVLP